MRLENEALMRYVKRVGAMDKQERTKFFEVRCRNKNDFELTLHCSGRGPQNLPKPQAGNRPIDDRVRGPESDGEGDF